MKSYRLHALGIYFETWGHFLKILPGILSTHQAPKDNQQETVPKFKYIWMISNELTLQSACYKRSALQSENHIVMFTFEYISAFVCVCQLCTWQTPVCPVSADGGHIR